MLLPFKSWLISVLLILLVAAGYYRAFEKLPLPTSDDQRVRNELAERWAQKVSSEIQQLGGRPTIAVAPVVGDDHATLTTELRRWIARRNVIMVHDDWVSGIGETFSTSRSPATRAEAVQSMIGQGIDYIVVAEVLEWTTYPEYDSQLVGIVQLLNGNDGSVTREFRLAMPEVIRVASSQPDSNSDSPQMSDDDSPAPSSVTPRQPSETAPDEALADFAVRPNTLTSGIATPTLTDVVSRFGVWLSAVATIPFGIRRIIVRTLRRHSNTSNLTLLTAWMLGCCVLAFLTWLPLLPSLIGTLAGLLTMAGAGLYFACVCHMLMHAWE